MPPFIENQDPRNCGRAVPSSPARYLLCLSFGIVRHESPSVRCVGCVWEDAFFLSSTFYGRRSSEGIPCTLSLAHLLTFLALYSACPFRLCNFSEVCFCCGFCFF
eukprot:RCo054229